MLLLKHRGKVQNWIDNYFPCLQQRCIKWEQISITKRSSAGCYRVQYTLLFMIPARATENSTYIHYGPEIFRTLRFMQGYRKRTSTFGKNSIRQVNWRLENIHLTNVKPPTVNNLSSTSSTPPSPHLYQLWFGRCQQPV